MYSPLPLHVNFRTLLMCFGRGLKRSSPNDRLKSMRRVKPTSGLKFVPTDEKLGARAVAIGVVVEAALVALVVAVTAVGRRARPVHAGADVLEERERAVDAVRLVRAGA